MSRETAKIFVLPAALLAIIIGGALPSQGQTSGAAFLTIPSSPRAYSLGQTQAISTLGAQAIGNNPANMGLMPDRFEFFTSYASGLGGTQYGHIAAAMATPNLGFVDSLGLAVTRLQTSGLQGTDASDNLTGSNFGAADTAVALSASGKIGTDLRLGLTAKVIQSQISSYNSNSAPAIDAGLTYTLSQLSRPISIGASVLNLGQGTKFISQTDPLPTSINGGVAAPLGPVMLVLELNRWIYNQITEIGAGVEYNLGPVAFRAGYLAQSGGPQNLAAQDQSSMGQILDGLTFGLGIHAGPLQIDYAAGEQAVDYGFTQRIGLTLRFGGKLEAKDYTSREISKPQVKTSLPKYPVQNSQNNDDSQWLMMGDK